MLETVKNADRFAPRFPSVALRTMDESEVGRPRGRQRVKNIVQGQMDARVQPLYDIIQVASATACVFGQLFTIPFGQQFTPTGGSATTKTYYHTNLKASGALPSPEKYLVKNIGVMARPDMAPADLNALIGQYVLRFQTLGKEFFTGHAQRCPSGSGGFVSGSGFQTSAANASGFSVANGWPSGNNVAPITDPVPDIPGYPPITPITGVLLEQAQPFEVSMDPTLTGTTVYTTASTVQPFVAVGLIAWVVFDGIRLVAIV